MNVAEAVGTALARRGVRHVFGLIGSGNFAVSNALVAAGAEFIAARHEGGAITMADAYARVTGRVGVCSVHQGPGLTNQWCYFYRLNSAMERCMRPWWSGLGVCQPMRIL